MIAMQYKIVLPADYSMDLIESRISEKGHLLNGYPGLIYKAYLYSRKDAKEYQSSQNSYAPFYIWEDHQSMLTFLQSDGFKGVCEQFGRPKVETWYVDNDAPKPGSQHSLAWIQDKEDNNSDIQALNFDAWETLSVTWCEGFQKIPNSSGKVYAIGYVTE